MEFNLPFEPTDWFDIGASKEDWTYITNNSVPGIEFNRYIISDFGRAYDLKRNLRCKEYDFGGYKTICLNTNYGTHTYLLHRIVMIEFHGRIDGKRVVNHINGIKYCCLDKNLEWMTDSENIYHAIDNGLNINIGENASLAKMTNEDALAIMRQLEKGIPLEEIAKTVPPCIDHPIGAIQAILAGRAWKKLARDNNIVFAYYKDRSNRFTEEEKDRVGYLISIGKSTEEILIDLGYYDTATDEELKGYRHTISDIRGGRVAKNVYEKYGLDKLKITDISRNTPGEIFTIEQLHEACRIFQSGFISYDDTLIKLGYDPSSMTKEERFRYVNALSALHRKKNYPKITSQYNF